jgi:DNA helicase-2/ATP-dependent DNA helicase PcrA
MSGPVFGGQVTTIRSEVTEDEDRAKVLGFIEDAITGSGVSSLDDLFAFLAVDHKESEAELETGKVNILTMHQAKGLTVDAVFIVSAEDEVVPQRLSQKEIDDDRRLLYVSMTRARHLLFITFCARRNGQQVHTGRNRGDPIRHITRLLRDSPLRMEPGEPFVEKKTTAKGTPQ